VHVRREFQRAGIGRRLVADTALALSQRERGAGGLIVWVIAGNEGARAFFERIGAELVAEQAFPWNGIELVEAGYGWRTLGALTASLPSVPPPGTICSDSCIAARDQGRGPRAISKRIKENKQ
jgi:hypothetical protein